MILVFFFFFNDTATTEIYTLSLHDALPICAYFDSLQIKGIPLHKIIVTSILRTKDDVAKLRKIGRAHV